ncbi:dehypoxanthine futalosine cyclase [Aliarcobacter butzleri]|uniref:dehypoxanthine futalosine cyclase n=1 Tax=Aliarcobacter butzleri TaxID=28197 RepID=UPI001EDA31F7|nr:dehypoxanthine futalosine cyclase [Aliarcobacter butzleri]MCG3676591.1 dehypoxanthine futalosine cyclase [Aliarcobacter butzleri]MCG3709029.1 dehypoxanthine futalosine cyclase [Aliarcobacter butzleri]MCT7563797.1 dehypoxanthine futalosine cyclase [Aliarcobacter butzleri]MCT7582498.1 dehypoxanthine futalosine cyclase [Aliarcobacter butzleri]MCT7612543.1 dehypoxanthine futalosine cyclase [Aliarcobacter butzleri]
MVKKVEVDLKKRLTNEEALDLIRNASLLELGEMASIKKAELHPEKITTFIVDRNINYTNVCWVDCKFCAFFRHGKDEDSYVLKFDEIDQKIEELLEIGGTQILFQGGVHPKLKIDYYEELVGHINTKYPQITIHGFSAIEIDFIARISKISKLEVLKRLQAKGLSSIPGAGAEILSDRVRDIIAPKKMDTVQWLEVHRLAHSIGMKTTATMMFGTVETDEEIIEHWEHLRKLQDETGGFRAFIMWSFQGQNTKLIEEHPEIKPQSSNRYLRLLAVARIYLDNFQNMQSSWVTQGSYIGQLALKFGANDLGSTMMEENVVKAAGAANRMNQDEMIRLIKDIGEYPAKRNTAYEILERF